MRVCFCVSKHRCTYLNKYYAWAEKPYSDIIIYSLSSINNRIFSFYCFVWCSCGQRSDEEERIKCNAAHKCIVNINFLQRTKKSKKSHSNNKNNKMRDDIMIFPVFADIIRNLLPFYGWPKRATGSVFFCRTLVLFVEASMRWAIRYLFFLFLFIYFSSIRNSTYFSICFVEFFFQMMQTVMIHVARVVNRNHQSLAIR